MVCSARILAVLKWSLLTTPLIILGGIVSTVIVCDFLFRKTMILESNLVLSASTSESKVFYLKMKGDYHMYMAKFKVGDERKEAAEDTMNSYKAAQYGKTDQRSSQCTMCWQPISLKDPNSQELLDAIERERSIRTNPSRNTAIFHHPTLGDFELQHLPISATDTELEELIIQHLAAAAAMGRARQIARKEGHRNRSSGQGHPHYLVFSINSNEPSAPASSSPSHRGEGETPSITLGGPTSPLTMGEESGHPNTPPPSVQSVQASGSRVLAANQRGASSTYSVGSSSSHAPFKPPSSGSTSDVVEASGTARPGEIVNTADANMTINRNALGRPLPTRPWLQTYTNNTYGDSHLNNPFGAPSSPPGFWVSFLRVEDIKT